MSGVFATKSPQEWLIDWQGTYPELAHVDGSGWDPLPITRLEFAEFLAFCPERRKPVQGGSRGPV